MRMPKSWLRPILAATLCVGVGQGQAALFERGRNRTSVVLGVNNLTNELYAEFANASFFRPEPRRSVSTAIVVEF